LRDTRVSRERWQEKLESPGKGKNRKTVAKGTRRRNSLNTGPFKKNTRLWLCKGMKPPISQIGGFLAQEDNYRGGKKGGPGKKEGKKVRVRTD